MANIRKTSASKLDWNVGTLLQMMDDKEIDFDASIQRGLVWDDLRISKFIHSILLEYPTGVFYVNKTSSGFECLEGKQRSWAIYNFVRLNKKLNSKTPSVTNKNGEEISLGNVTFSELPNEFKNIIMRYGLLVLCFDDISIENKVDFFTRINSGKPVTAADISRIKVKSRKIFQELSKHPLMETILSSKAINKFQNEDIIKNIWILCYAENKSLLDRDTSVIFEKIDVSKEQEEELKKILDYMSHYFKEILKSKDVYNKTKAKVHIISLGYLAYSAVKNELWEDEYYDVAFKFFNTGSRRPSFNDEYNNACTSGVARADKVLKRMGVLDKTLKEWIKENKDRERGI
jgi:hypothetical protein